MFSEMFFSSKNCSSVISCWVNKGTLSVKQPYCMNCHKWNCSELTRTIDHTFICLFWSCFSSFLLVLALMLCNIYSAQILKSVTLLSIFARRNVKGHEKAQQQQLSQFWNERLAHTVLISMADFHHLGQRSVLILSLAM